MTLYEVTGCKDCPFLYRSSNHHASCSHKEAMRELVTDYLNNRDGDSYPVWCPLKKQETIIKLKI